MARTLSTVETSGEIETGTEDSWFVRGAMQAGLFVQDGKVYGGQDGYLFEVPAPESCEASAAFLAYSLVKHCEYRIAQNKGGDLSAETEKFVADLANWEPARKATVSAGEVVYLNAVEQTVRGLITDADGSEVKIADTYLIPYTDDDGNRRLRSVPKGTEGAFRMQAVIDSIAKDQRGVFDRVVASAIERGRNKPTEEKGEAKRGGRKPRTMDLGISLG